MRRLLTWIVLVYLALASPVARAATGRLIKVLPEFLDLKGQNSIYPSLYERDAHQLFLREHPEKRSTMRFYVQWKTKGPSQEPVKLRLDMRGIAQGNLPKHLTVDEAVKPGGWFSHWTGVTLTGQQYKDLGEVTAWRVTLWEGERLLGEQRSFLW